MKEEKLCIENTELDQKLWDGGVRFLPWIGKDYDKGLSYDKDGKLILGTDENPGKKILVLGESHYIEDYDPDVDIRHFTRDVIFNYVDLDAPFQRWMNTFTKFIRALYGEEYDRAQSAGLFNHLAFYNYLQVPISGPRMAGSNDDYEQAQEPFFNLLEEKMIEPDVVIIWGNRLWKYLPDSHGFDWYKEYTQDDDTHRSGKYVVNGKDVVLIPIYHPSVGFSYEYWNKVICHLL